MNRRQLLAGASVVAVTGCALTPDTFNNIRDQVLTYAQNILDGIANTLVNLQSFGIDQAILDKIAAIETQVRLFVTALQTTVTTANAQDLERQIETYLNQAVGVLAGLPLPPQILAPLQIAVLVLPLLEGLLNMVISPVAQANAAAAHRALTRIQAPLPHKPIR